jgi:hypothetical protein
VWISESGDVLPKPHSVRAEGDGSTCRGILDTRDSQKPVPELSCDRAMAAAVTRQSTFRTQHAICIVGVSREALIARPRAMRSCAV